MLVRAAIVREEPGSSEGVPIFVAENLAGCRARVVIRYAKD